jgi:hypothetical protein
MTEYIQLFGTVNRLRVFNAPAGLAGVRRAQAVWRRLLYTMVFTSAAFTSPNAHAIPSFGRQTGMQCAACHTVFPELTPFGRQFKLRGFALGNGLDEKKFPLSIPVSAVVMLSDTITRNTNTPGAMSENFPRDREGIVQTAGIYYGGKITNQSGALIQYNYDGIERKWGMEMFDMRYAGSGSVGGKELIYGVTLNNSPTVSDVYNSTPVWSFPNVGSAAVMPNAGALLDMKLASQVGGVGAYGLWDNLLYGELTLYRTAHTGAFRLLGLSVPTEDIVKGSAPYWRLALQRETGPHSFSVGTYGMIGKIYADAADFNLGANRFKDIALDGQYQFIDGDHIFSTHATWIREKQEWNASFPSGLTSSQSTILRTFRADMRYSYGRQWSGGLQYFLTNGDADDKLYNTGEAVMGSANGSPNRKGWVAQLDFLPQQNIKLALRYTAYNKFNGSSSNYDGFGRDASNNNSLYLLSWFMF